MDNVYPQTSSQTFPRKVALPAPIPAPERYQNNKKEKLNNNDLKKIETFLKIQSTEVSTSNTPKAPAATASSSPPLIAKNREYVFPRFDRSLFNDDRTLANMLTSEERSNMQISCKYFSCVQTEVVEDNRRVLVEWMLEVSEEDRCEPEVFLLAVHYLDRFLSTQAVHRRQLQVLGAACLFLASKIKQPRPIVTKKLIDYAAGCFDADSLMSWELLLLNRLKWDLDDVAATDILEHLLHRLKLPRSTESHLRPQVNLLVAQVALDFQLAILPPSIIAVGCLCVAFRNFIGSNNCSQQILFALKPILRVDTYAYEPYVDAIYSHIKFMRISGDLANGNSMSEGSNREFDLSDRSLGSAGSSHFGTPTDDVRDNNFL